MRLPVVVLRVGRELQRVVDVVDVVGADASQLRLEVRTLVKRMTDAQRTSVREEIASLWQQFDPDAAYVLVSPDGVRGRGFDDDHAFIGWLQWVENAVNLAITARDA
jgi:hypothetical protein